MTEPDISSPLDTSEPKPANSPEPAETVAEQSTEQGSSAIQAVETILDPAVTETVSESLDLTADSDLATEDPKQSVFQKNDPIDSAQVVHSSETVEEPATIEPETVSEGTQPDGQSNPEPAPDSSVQNDPVEEERMQTILSQDLDSVTVNAPVTALNEATNSSALQIPDTDSAEIPSTMDAVIQESDQMNSSKDANHDTVLTSATEIAATESDLPKTSVPPVGAVESSPFAFLPIYSASNRPGYALRGLF